LFADTRALYLAADLDVSANRYFFDLGHCG
jgi:hypothetical protein